MELKDAMYANMLLRNNTPLGEFLGLSPTEVHALLYHTFTEKSPVQLKKNLDDAVINQIPFFRIAEEFLRILHREKFIKLTPLGALPKKVMVELYDHRILLDEHIERGLIKLHREQDCIAIRAARFICELAGFIKKVRGKLLLTKLGDKMLRPENRQEFLQHVVQAFTTKFNWGIHDRYPDHPVGQLGWAFTVFMLRKYGKKPRHVKFYADKYITAFPTMLTFFKADYATPQARFLQCYHVRTFERFLVWFGFVSLKTKKGYSDPYTDQYTSAPCLKNIFLFE